MKVNHRLLWKCPESESSVTGVCIARGSRKDLLLVLEYKKLSFNQSEPTFTVIYLRNESYSDFLSQFFFFKFIKLGFMIGWQQSRWLKAADFQSPTEQPVR